jgi:cell division protein FtsB
MLIFCFSLSVFCLLVVSAHVYFLFDLLVKIRRLEEQVTVFESGLGSLRSSFAALSERQEELSQDVTQLNMGVR